MAPPPITATPIAPALIRWAEACLLRAAGDDAAAAARPTDGAHIAVGRIFGLTELEVAALQLVHAVERSLGLMARARQLAGPTARGLTVEVLRAAIGSGIDAALAPGQTLRRHALLVLDDAGAVSATSEVRLGAGLGARLDGRSARGELGPAVLRVAATEGAALPAADPRAQAIAFELAREDNDVARLVTVGGCGRREAAQLAAALIGRLQRGVVLVDGEALAAAGRPWETLLAARRDADLDGDILLVVEAQASGAAWRAACAPPPTLAPRPILSLLTEPSGGREALLLEGLKLKAMTLPVGQVGATAPGAAATALPAAPMPEKKPDDGFDEIRQMAVRDAERALGIIRPMPAPRPTVPGTVSSRPLPAVTVVPPTTAQPAPQPVQPAPAPTPAPAPVAATPPPAAPPPAAPPPAPAAAKGKMGSKARAMLAARNSEDNADVLAYLAKMRERDAGAAPATEEAPAATETTAEPAAAAPPVVAAPVAAAPAPASTGGLSAQEIAAAEAQPYMEVADNAPVAVLARIAQSSPNPKQRAEILQSLHRVRDPAAMAAMRANAASAHPAVRAVAETGMQLLFGPAWNTTRAMAKPVQPPRTDDGKDRGPPGGW